jgi:hypothetical protein
MTILAATIDCIAGGFSKVTLSFSAYRTGSNNDEYEMRIVRKRAGTADAILPGTPRFNLTTNEDIRSYSWIDPNIPSDGDYTYTLQVRRLAGLGQFNEMTLIAEHFKK